MEGSEAAGDAPQPIGVRSRLIGLSDHVFGFAATLLAARLVLPLATGGESPVSEIGDRLDTLGIYAFGFLVIGYQWWRHHQVFVRIERVSTGLLWLNLAVLACIAVMPYPTSVLGESRVPLAVAMVVVPLLGASLGLIAVWELALARGLLRDELDTATRRSMRIQLGILPAVLAASLALLPLGTAAALASWVLLPVLLLVVHRLTGDDVDSPATRLRRSEVVDDGLERLIAYSDGIYAVVLTIIAEQLGGDERTVGADLSDAQLWAQVTEQWPTFFAFGLTFFTVGLFWTVHAEVFARIIRLRTPLLWLALVHLMVIALQPFGLSVFTDYGAGDSSDATAIFLAFMLAASVTVSLVGLYADWGNRCVDPATTAHTRTGHRWQSALAAAIFAGGVAVALATDDANSSWAFAVLALFPITDAILERRFPETATRFTR